MTDTNKHTPGPWKLGKIMHDRCYREIDADSWDGFSSVVVRMRGNNFDSPEGLANARLIAAAPDLLAALERLLEDFADMFRDPELLAMALDMVRRGKALEFDSDGGPDSVRQSFEAIAKAREG